MITAALLQRLGATGGRAARFVAPLDIAAEKYGIDTPQRVAAWLGQLAHESARFGRVVEDLNYSADGLAATWPARYRGADGRPNALALRLHRKPEAIADTTYADRLGNGDAASGDGWRYRGRGLIQITGKDNYRRCSAALGLDLLARPWLLESPLYAAMSAAWFWRAHGLNVHADRADLRAVTRAINGGLNGLQDRIDLSGCALAILSPIEAA